MGQYGLLVMEEGISKFDGKKYTVFTKKNGLPADKTRKVFPFKDNVYVGTEQGVSIINIETNKVISPKVPKTNEDFICIDFFTYKDEVYFITVFEGLFKINTSQSIPKIVKVIDIKNNYSVQLVDKTLYIGKEGYVQETDIDVLSFRYYKV